MHFCQDCHQFTPGICGGYPRPTVNPYEEMVRQQVVAMTDAEVNRAFGLDEEQLEPNPVETRLVASQADVPALIEVIPLHGEAR